MFTIYHELIQDHLQTSCEMWYEHYNIMACYQFEPQYDEPTYKELMSRYRYYDC